VLVCADNANTLASFDVPDAYTLFSEYLKTTQGQQKHTRASNLTNLVMRSRGKKRGIGTDADARNSLIVSSKGLDAVTVDKN